MHTSHTRRDNQLPAIEMWPKKWYGCFKQVSQYYKNISIMEGFIKTKLIYIHCTETNSQEIVQCTPRQVT